MGGGSKHLGTPAAPQEGVERSASLPGDFRVIVGPIPVQMDDFCDLHGTPDTPVSRIVTVKVKGKFVTSPKVNFFQNSSCPMLEKINENYDKKRINFWMS